MHMHTLSLWVVSYKLDVSYKLKGPIFLLTLSQRWLSVLQMKLTSYPPSGAPINFKVSSLYDCF
jgi:hypothetical protein